MTISEFKKDAKLKLSGKWIKAALITLVYILIVGALEMVGSLSKNETLNSVYKVVISIINVPFSFGYLAQIIKLSRGEEVNVFDFITIGLQSLGKVYAVLGRTIQKLILPIIAFTVAIIFFIISLSFVISSTFGGFNGSAETSYVGLFILSLILFFIVLIYWIAKSLSYELTSYILLDNQNATGKEIVEKSEKLMQNNKLNYLKLAFSFIGWYFIMGIVCVIPIIGYIAAIIGFLFLSPYITVSMFNFYENLNDTVVITANVKDDNENDNDNDDENIDPIQ